MIVLYDSYWMRAPLHATIDAETRVTFQKSLLIKARVGMRVDFDMIILLYEAIIAILL